MNKYTTGFLAAALSAAAMAPTAIAQTSAATTAAAAVELTAGATVFGPQGNEVGKIDAVNGDVVVVNTGTVAAGLPKSAFAAGAKGPVIGFTKAQLESAATAAAQQAGAKLDSLLVAGTALRSSDGVALGTVKSVGADGQVEVDANGRGIKLQKDLFAADAEGLTLRVTAAELEKAVAASAATQTPAPTQ